MTKEVAKANTTTELAVYNEADLQAWGSNELSSKDIIIPALILCQQMSDFVTKEKIAKQGDYVDSVTHENFGNVLKDLIPFQMEKSWTIQLWNAKKSKYEYAYTEKMTPETENLPYEFETAEGKFRRVYTYRFYVLMPGKLLPYTIKFKSSSREAGKNLATEMFVKNLMKKLPPPAYKIDIVSKEESNDDGVYAVSTIRMGERSTHEQVMDAFNWMKTLQSNKSVVVDDSKDF
jgi:hypothetical protein